MKLRTILENGTIIRDAGKALGDLIHFVTDLGPNAPEYAALIDFLQQPNATNWEKTKWVVDAAIRRAIGLPDTSYRQRIEQWGKLKTLQAPIAAASAFAVQRQDTGDTPLKRLSLSNSDQKKLMASLGPQGFVSTLSNVDDLPPTKTKRMLKDLADKSQENIKAAKSLPGVKIQKRF